MKKQNNVKKDVKNEFEGSVLNALYNLYFNINFYQKISHQEFIAELQKRYTNEEMKGLLKKRYAEIAPIFENIVIEKAYNKKPEEDPSFFEKIKSGRLVESYDLL